MAGKKLFCNENYYTLLTAACNGHSGGHHDSPSTAPFYSVKQRIFSHRTTPIAAADPRKSPVRRNSIGRDTMRTPASGARSPIPTHDDKQLSASWAGSDFGDSHHWHVSKKPTDLEPISTSMSEAGIVPSNAQNFGTNLLLGKVGPKMVFPKAMQGTYNIMQISVTAADSS